MTPPAKRRLLFFPFTDEKMMLRYFYPLSSLRTTCPTQPCPSSASSRFLWRKARPEGLPGLPGEHSLEPSEISPFLPDDPAELSLIAQQMPTHLWGMRGGKQVEELQRAGTGSFTRVEAGKENGPDWRSAGVLVSRRRGGAAASLPLRTPCPWHLGALPHTRAVRRF